MNVIDFSAFALSVSPDDKYSKLSLETHTLVTSVVLTEYKSLANSKEGLEQLINGVSRYFECQTNLISSRKVLPLLDKGEPLSSDCVRNAVRAYKKEFEQKVSNLVYELVKFRQAASSLPIGTSVDISVKAKLGTNCFMLL
jgi:hypothetical protein